MTITEISLLMMSVLTSVGGQFFLKSGAIKLGRVSTINIISIITNFSQVNDLMIGICLYALGAISYILLLTRVDLSVAAPCISLSYIFSVIIGILVFRETILASRIIGLFFITLGVSLVIWQR